LGLLAKEKQGMPGIVIHPFFDGRDIFTSMHPGWQYIQELFANVNQLGIQDIFKVADVSGRYFGMDRDAIKRDKKGEPSQDLWRERVEPSYRAAVYSEGRQLAASSNPMASSSAITTNSVIPEHNISGDISPDKAGGIDFGNKAMASSTVYQPMGSFVGLDFNLPKLSASEIAGFDLDKEELLISRSIDNGILISGSRIKEFMSASAMKGQFDQRRATVVTWLAKLGILEESICCTRESSKDYKEAVVIADSYLN
jgi:hypothetical protein